MGNLYKVTCRYLRTVKKIFSIINDLNDVIKLKKAAPEISCFLSHVGKSFKRSLMSLSQTSGRSVSW